MTHYPSRPRTRLALALMMSTSLTLAAASLASPAQADPSDAFFSSSYTYCDAKLIGALWGISIENAKSQIGQKIVNGIGDNVPTILAESRRAGNRCDWVDTSYAYSDAEELAGVWGTDVDRAKAKIAAYLTNGQKFVVDRALGH